MPELAIRFLHSSDWHLERPVGGLCDVPEPLAELFLKAPLKAARRVVDTALAEDVDFVVLSGDIIHADRAGPHVVLFLREQFERLAKRGIEVYWAGGQVDSPEHWPSAIQLPRNVHRFPVAHPQSLAHERHRVAVARITGQSAGHPQRGVRAADFQADPSGLFTVAVAHGSQAFESLAESDVSYWALGGDHVRSTPLAQRHIIHLPGTHQGRIPVEAGPHGCTLVEVDETRHIRLRFVSSDIARWHHERVMLSHDATRAELEATFVAQTEKLIEAGGTDSELLICWTIGGEGHLLRQLRHASLVREMATSLRERFTSRWPRAWCAWIEADPPQSWSDAWYEQDDLRGDFLREVLQYQTGQASPLEGRAYEAETALLADAGMVGVLEHVPVERLLRRAAALGVELLSAEDSES